MLLQQAGALWLRTDTVDGTPVTVFASPPTRQAARTARPKVTADTSPLRLWVDAAALLRRAEVRLGSRLGDGRLPGHPGAPAGAARRNAG